jgi:ankyrin repeat protein
VKLLLEKGANINIQNEDNKTPLDLAKEKGYENIVNLLEESDTGSEIQKRKKIKKN